MGGLEGEFDDEDDEDDGTHPSTLDGEWAVTPEDPWAVMLQTRASPPTSTNNAQEATPEVTSEAAGLVSDGFADEPDSDGGHGDDNDDSALFEMLANNRKQRDEEQQIRRRRLSEQCAAADAERGKTLTLERERIAVDEAREAAEKKRSQEAILVGSQARLSEITFSFDWNTDPQRARLKTVVPKDGDAIIAALAASKGKAADQGRDGESGQSITRYKP